MRIEEYDAMSERDAVDAVRPCVEIVDFAVGLAASRPYRSRVALLARAATLASQWSDADVEAALAGHPRIGEDTGDARSRIEQAGVGTDARTTERLREGNARYEERFGRIYLVRATGRTAEEMLALLEQRLDNDETTERQVTRSQLAEITLLRLKELVTT